ncbi:hypothetical protein QEG73_18600 [Chitinophagaceae bacterium 26-R-25]|nr:hypothetical protein [Chitinophagaceae bacterium 26-R-25]
MFKYPVIIFTFLFAHNICVAQRDCEINYIRGRQASYKDSARGFLLYCDEIKNTFEYRIYNYTIDSVTRIYCGTLKTAADTLYLNYNQGKMPANFKPFLIKEFSGNYYIQYFDDGTRKFLWKRPLGY